MRPVTDKHEHPPALKRTRCRNLDWFAVIRSNSAGHAQIDGFCSVTALLVLVREESAVEVARKIIRFAMQTLIRWCHRADLGVGNSLEVSALSPATYWPLGTVDSRASRTLKDDG